MNLDHNFAQVSKLSEDQKIGLCQKMEQFFSPNSGQDQKKGLHQKRTFFFPEFKWTPTLRCTPKSNYWGNADVDHTETIGGI